MCSKKGVSYLLVIEDLITWTVLVYCQPFDGIRFIAFSQPFDVGADFCDFLYDAFVRRISEIFFMWSKLPLRPFANFHLLEIPILQLFRSTSL